MVWLLDETAANMVAAKCWLQIIDKTRGKFLLEIKSKIFPFKMNLIPWAPVQNINKALKVSRLWVTCLKILVANTQFSAGRNFRSCMWLFKFIFLGSTYLIWKTHFCRWKHMLESQNGCQFRWAEWRRGRTQAEIKTFKQFFGHFEQQLQGMTNFKGEFWLCF